MMRFRLGVCLFIVLILCTACQLLEKKPEIDMKISDPSSPLLSVALSEDDLSDLWDLKFISINQWNEVASENNDWTSDRVSIRLDGRYGDTEAWITLANIVRKHQIPFPGISADDMAMEEGGVLFSLEFNNINYEMQARCYRISRVAHCRTMVNYGSITSIVTIYTPATMTDDELESILNTILMNIDGRVQELLVNK